MVALPSFKIGTNLKINLNDEKDKPDVKSNKEHKKDVKHNIEFNKESKPDIDKITYEAEKAALILGMSSIFTVWWMFK